MLRPVAGDVNKRAMNVLEARIPGRDRRQELKRNSSDRLLRYHSNPMKPIIGTPQKCRHDDDRPHARCAEKIAASRHGMMPDHAFG
jgi:hypothetical protein